MKTTKPTTKTKPLRRFGQETAAIIPRPAKGKPEVIIPAKKRPAP